MDEYDKAGYKQVSAGAEGTIGVRAKVTEVVSH